MSRGERRVRRDANPINPIPSNATDAGSGTSALTPGKPAGTEKLKFAASLEMRPVTQFVTFYAVQAAENIISKAKGDKE